MSQVAVSARGVRMRFRQWFDGQSAKVGAATGTLGGLCCIGSAVASRHGMRPTGRLLIRHGLVMASVYAITLGLTVAAMQVAKAL